MGEVYLAKDTKLDRRVALKILPTDFSRDSQRIRRFLQEARIASSLNHQNICVIHEVGEFDDGRPFIAMEYVEGQSLEVRMASGPIETRELVNIAIQIADALVEAHGKGVVHRDIKPENIVITPRGQVKVLDFGLAKMTGTMGDDTMTQVNTGAGVLMGTIRYMSPEQALGQEVDHRTDIFSLGVVLYGLANGCAPFTGENALDTLDRIAHVQAEPIVRLNATLSPELERIIFKCLEKSPECRYSNASELLLDLRGLKVDLARTGEKGRGGIFPKFFQTAMGKVILALAVGAVLTVVLLQVLPHPQPKKVAVLPLAYQGPSEKAVLAQMIPAALTESLRGFSGLEVAPFASSRTYKADGDPLVAGRQLGVDWITSGILSVQDQKYQASLRLFRRGSELWKREFHGPLDQSLATYEQIVEGLAGALGAKKRVNTLSMNSRAMEAYLEGKRYLEGWDIKSNYELAMGAFEKAVKSDEAFAEAHAGLALALWKSWEETREASLVDHAFSEAQRALSLNPSLPEAHLALGVVLLGRGRSAEAAAAFEESLRLAPADDAVCRRIGDAYEKLNREEDAAKMYERAIELRPQYWENYNYKGVFFRDRGKLEEAKTLFRKVIELHPETDSGYTNLATVHLMAGELEEAEPFFRAAIEIQPSPYALNNLGIVYYSTGRFEKAAEEFKRAIESGHNHAEPWANLGDAYRHLNRTNLAREAYVRAIQLYEARLKVNGADSEARSALAYTLAGYGRCAEAQKHILQIVFSDVQKPLIHYYTALACAICQDDDAATGHMIAAIKGGLAIDVKTNPDLAHLLKQPAIDKLLR